MNNLPETKTGILVGGTLPAVGWVGVSLTQLNRLDVDYFHFPPLILHHLCRDPSVTMFRLRLAAQQAADLLLEHTPIQPRGHAALREQLPVARLPGSRVLTGAVGLHQAIRGRQLGLVDIIDAGQLAQEEGQVAVLGEASQLAARVDADVDDPLDAVGFEQAKEFLSRFLGKTDGKYFHFLPYSPQADFQSASQE